MGKAKKHIMVSEDLVRQIGQFLKEQYALDKAFGVAFDAAFEKLGEIQKLRDIITKAKSGDVTPDEIKYFEKAIQPFL